MADIVQAGVVPGSAPGAEHAPAHAAGAHGHDPNLAHHFDTAEQQFEASKLGMWLFLATEVLMFAGLFCAYTVYRSLHPEIFIAGHGYLDKAMGAINTVVLLVSSFTMACAVYCAQTSRKTWLVIMLALTLAGGAGFMCIKYVEYSHKIHDGLLWGEKFHPAYPPEGATLESAPAAPAAAPGAASPAPAPATLAPGEQPTVATPERWNYTAPAAAPEGVTAAALKPAADDDAHRPVPYQVKNLWIFFGIYFVMTGLHGIHVLAGMGVIAWLLVQAIKGRFSSAYFTPVDLGGLYWHLVDLVWIFLFPLLYLIH